MESKRVRTARALDEIEGVVNQCCEMAREEAEKKAHVQNTMAFDILGEVDEIAEWFGVDFDELKSEAIGMLRNGLHVTLDGLVLEKKVEPYMVDSVCHGMKVKFYAI